METDDSSVSANQIIKGLLTEDDINVKTEIWNPIAASTFDILGDKIEIVLQQKAKAKDIKDLCQGWMLWLRRNMISYKRQSRKEVVQAVTNVRPDETQDLAKSLLERALGATGH